MRAVERHVLQVMRDAALLLGFIQRARAHVNPHNGATRWIGMFHHDVLHAVVQLPRDQRGIAGQLRNCGARKTIAGEEGERGKKNRREEFVELSCHGFLLAIDLQSRLMSRGHAPHTPIE